MAKLQIPKTKIVGLAGNDEPTSVLGDPIAAPAIAKASLEVIRCFAEAIIKQDIEMAYGLCANEFRCGTSVKQFVAKLDAADGEYNGKPLEFSIEQITWIYCDEISRQRNNDDGDWPDATPKSNKRAIGYGWLTDQKTAEGNFGRHMSFWVTEEADGYCIAKFEQYPM